MCVKRKRKLQRLRGQIIEVKLWLFSFLTFIALTHLEMFVSLFNLLFFCCMIKYSIYVFSNDFSASAWPVCDIIQITIGTQIRIFLTIIHVKNRFCFLCRWSCVFAWQKQIRDRTEQRITDMSVQDERGSNRITWHRKCTKTNTQRRNQQWQDSFSVSPWSDMLQLQVAVDKLMNVNVTFSVINPSGDRCCHYQQIIISPITFNTWYVFINARKQAANLLYIPDWHELKPLTTWISENESTWTNQKYCMLFNMSKCAVSSDCVEQRYGPLTVTVVKSPEIISSHSPATPFLNLVR